MKKIVVAEKGIAIIVAKAVGKAAHASRPHLGCNAISAMSRFLSLISEQQLKHKYDSLFPEGPTVNIGLIRGGVAPNQVAADCEVIHDIRYLPSQTPSRIINELKQLSKQVRDKGVKFSFTLRGSKELIKVPSSSVVVRTIQKHAKARLVGIGGGTVNKLMIRNGISSVGFGPGDEDAAHVADEWVDVKELAGFATLIGKIAVELSNTKIS